MIYDIIINPLDLENLLQGYINFKILSYYALDISDCFYRAVKDFPTGPQSMVFVSNKCGVKKLSDYDRDEIIWNRFHDIFPSMANELQYALDLCIDVGISKKTIYKEQLLKQFLMNRLRQILILIPSVHKDHIFGFSKDENTASLGPVNI